MTQVQNLNNWATITGVMLLTLLGSSIAQTQTQLLTQPTQPAQSIQPTQAPKKQREIGASASSLPNFSQGETSRANGQNELPSSRMDRPLRLSVTVDDQSFLQVREGEQVKEGDVITDNKRERDRLTKEQKSINLHIQNLKNKAIHKPFEPKQPLPSKPLPPAVFSEQEATISHAQLRLKQAQSVLFTRTSVLSSENPERRSEVDKAQDALKNAENKVLEQEELIKSMKDMKLQSEILQHEGVKLKQFSNEEEQARSEVLRAEAKLDASTIEQQQQLQQLEIAVRLAQSELEVAKSRLTDAQSRRQMVEYQASIDEAKKSQQENQTQQEYSRQQQQYEQSTRERDYQLAQLSIALSTIDDKLSQIPVVLSPRSGYIRRIKPWVGNNGKYTTTITISLGSGVAKSPNGSSKGQKAKPS